MRTNILLAIDVPANGPHDLEQLVSLTHQLVSDVTSHVVVLHVQEFSIPLLARNILDHGGASGRRTVDALVARLRSAGIQASGLIREADFGHVARAILDAADEFDARVIVLGSPRPPARRHLAGGVAEHVLRMATRPVLVAPRIRRPVLSTTPALAPGR